jgi:hypothetical protein
MPKFNIVATTMQTHAIGSVEASNEEEAIRKAETVYADELAAAAKRCRTGQLHDIHARAQSDSDHG